MVSQPQPLQDPLQNGLRRVGEGIEEGHAGEACLSLGIPLARSEVGAVAELAG